jgi:transcriptional regulator with XRE-family HTH domain
MLQKLPKQTPAFSELVADLGSHKREQIARALGVSRRTIDRWMKSGAPRTACLALWWLSREGHSFWDAEMQNRTALALQTNDALWRKVRSLESANRARASANDAQRELWPVSAQG